jgi:hypothetical protein
MMWFKVTEREHIRNLFLLKKVITLCSREASNPQPVNDLLGYARYQYATRLSIGVILKRRVQV